MEWNVQRFISIFTLGCIISVVNCSRLNLTSNAPVVLGATIVFKGELITDSPPGTDSYQYKWRDSGIPTRRKDVKTNATTSEWSIDFPADKYAPGKYKVELVVEKWWVMGYYILTSERIEFEVTRFLNGDLLLTQNGTVRPNEYISGVGSINQTIDIKNSDMDFIRKNSTSITTYWFIDCVYFGPSNNFTLVNNYNIENQKFDIEALVVISFDPLPEPVTTTTTTTTTTMTTTTTTPATTTTSTSTTSTTPSPAPNTTTPATTTPPTTTAPTTTSSSTSPVKHRRRRESHQIDELDMDGVPDDLPFVCLNKSNIAFDPKKLYGHFKREVIVKNPIANLEIKGKNWLQPSEVLNLDVMCTGSPPYNYCIQIKDENYNMTGSETCKKWLPLDTCQFPIVHYTSKTYKIIVIVKNDVAQVNKEVTVNMYEVQKQSQLSVIVVPVSFCLAAVILVVYGVAYYVQNRSRFVVEVADFNFGETASVDMEYKTFRQRLVDSVREIVVRRPNDDQASDSSLKYGSMT